MAIEIHPPNGASVSVHLFGEIRYTSPGPEAGVRVGIEFVGLSQTERSILDALQMMNVAW